MFKLRNTPCTFNKTVYEENKALFNCQRPINVYYCIQNQRNRSGEICVQPVWVQPGEFYIHMQEVDTFISYVILYACMFFLRLVVDLYMYINNYIKCVFDWVFLMFWVLKEMTGRK